MKLLRLPGLIDCHVHLREPGAIYKEDFYSGTSAALAGGYVKVIDMPNNSQPTTSLTALAEKRRLAAKKIVCDVGFHFGADQNNWGSHKKASKKTYGLKIFMNQTTGPLLIENLEVLRNHFRFWPKEKPIMVHAEDSTLAKAITFAWLYQKWLHVCHLNQASELELVKQARKRGVRITCETAPHYLFLTNKDEKSLGNFAKMRPPLATKKDQQALWQAVNDGTIDILATDHAPHTVEEKKSKEPPNGIPGLETALPLMLTAVNKKKLSLKRLKELMCYKPAELFGIKIDKNSWIEVDLTRSWRLKIKALKTKCGWSPFAGWLMKGKLISVFIRGKKVFENGQILAKKGSGKLL